MSARTVAHLRHYVVSIRSPLPDIDWGQALAHATRCLTCASARLCACDVQEGVPFTGSRAVPTSPPLGAPAAVHIPGDSLCAVGRAGNHAIGRYTVCW